MNILTSTISNAISQIAKSIQISTIVPSALLVILNILFIVPRLGVSLDDSFYTISMLTLFVIALSYLLWLANGPFIKLLEGYSFNNTSIGRQWTKAHRDLVEKLDKEIEKCNKNLQNGRDWLKYELPLRYRQESRSGTLKGLPEYQEIQRRCELWKVRLAELTEVRMRYPNAPTRILPTDLGNRIASFEEYAFDRYEINSTALWPRMVPILETNGFASYVEREKAAFDFLLNLMVVTALLGIEFALVGAMKLDVAYAIVSVIALVLTRVFYPVLVVNAEYWGNMVKVAFDLYRHELREQMLMKTPENLEQEREIWHALSAFIVHNKNPPKLLMDYSLLNQRQIQKEQKGEEKR